MARRCHFKRPKPNVPMIVVKGGPTRGLTERKIDEFYTGVARMRRRGKG